MDIFGRKTEKVYKEWRLEKKYDLKNVINITIN